MRTATVTTDFRNRLRQELLDRCKRNPTYSLRAFASHLDMDPSTLSKILNGKRPLGRKLVLQLGSKMGLSTREIGAFLNRASSGAAEDAAESADHEMGLRLALDRFAVISDWYHFAILELMQVKAFRPEASWIAKALGLKVIEVDAAIERLERVGLLKIHGNGQWQDLSYGFSTSIGPDMISTAHRRLQEQFLEKSAQALVCVPIQDRDHTTMTVAIDKSRLPVAREKIKRFRRSLAKFLSEGDVLDDVFNLNIALFPLTNLNERKNS
jgi:uncharacterized protein (TIGR02147 family)